MTWVGDSGLRRLIRGSYDDWDAYWDNLDYSNANGRVVDKIRGEAARADLQTYELRHLEQNYDSKIRALEEERDESVGQLDVVFSRK